mgnify:CR=1 FL=1
MLGIIGSCMPKTETPTPPAAAVVSTPPATTKAAAPKTSTEAPKPTKSESKADLVASWWMEDSGIFIARYLKSLDALELAASKGDGPGMISECGKIVDWNTISSSASVYQIGSLSDIDPDLDDTLGNARASFKSLAKNCKAVFDKGELTKTEDLGYDLGMSSEAFKQVKEGTYDKYLI